MDPTTTAIGTWSGGRFMRFGEPLPDERLAALLCPGDGIDTVITADAYSAGDADSLLGQALQGMDRDSYCLVGAIGHDFYDGERDGARGFPRFTDSRLRAESGYADYIRMATERSLARLKVERFDLLLLHNPDRTGYSSPAVWEGMRAVRDAGLTRLLGVAPGPANGFTLDLIDCLERFSELIDWAMIILNPLEPWPGELVLGAATAHDVSLITRVVDYGGVFHDDVLPGHVFAEYDHRKFRPEGWVREGREKLELMRPYAERHGLTMLQLACAWNLAQPGVRCVAPTLIQESGLGGGSIPRPIEDKRAELAELGAGRSVLAGGTTDAALAAARGGGLLSAEEVDAIREIGDNTGCMALKGASTEHEGPSRPDRWQLDEALSGVACRWGIDPARDLAQRALAPVKRDMRRQP
jgi:aryl-alcohol dehydrogenase-like predicted oxidoreductase